MDHSSDVPAKRPKIRFSAEEVRERKKAVDRARDRTRINIGRAFTEWRELRESEACKTDVDLAFLLMQFYEKTATSTPLVHGFTSPPPAAVSTILSDRKGQEMKSEGFGPWSSVSPKLEQVQEDGDGNDLSSFSVDIIQVKQEVPVQVKQDVPVQVKQDVPVQVKQDVPVQVKQEVPVQVKQDVPVQVKQEVPVQVKQEVPVQVKQEVPVQVKEEVPVQVKQEVPVQVKQEVPVQVKQEVPVQVKQEVPVQVKQEVPVQVKQEVPVQVKQEVPVQVKQEVPVQVKQEVPVQVKQEVPVQVKQEVPVQVKQEVPVQVKQDVPVQVKQDVPVQVKQDVPVQVKQDVPVQVKQDVPVQVKQDVPVQVKQEVPVQVKQDVPVQVKQEVPVQVKQEVPVQVKQDVPVQVKQEDPDESEFWCMQQDPEMSGGIDAIHQVQLTFNILKEETDRYCGKVELLPSEHPVQTLKSGDLKTEEAIEEQSMDRKGYIKVCSNSISNQTTHMQTNQVSSTTTQLVSTVSELTMKGQCENCLILAKVREELQIQIAVLQNRIRAIICTKVSQHSVCSPHCDLDYEKLLKGFHKNCLGKNPLCKASENTTRKVNHVRDFILHMTKGYPPIKTLLFLDNMERINEWVVTLQNGNMNVRHYLLDVLAFLKFLNRTSRPIAHLTRHSRNHISRQLRQKLKNINTLIKSHKRALKDSGNNPSTPKRRVNKSTS
ncbi:uncharacterized protein LOC143716740 isoform X4 [Siphateles boraxobius]|uniref:uncharacterized protein LOC143716740 isoform X4 n=1 Tax=Siphateles boraxobius TaxID=180520 RepID=UPI004062FAFC